MDNPRLKSTDQIIQELQSLETTTASSSIYEKMQVYVLVSYEDPTDDAFYNGEIVKITEDSVSVKLLNGSRKIIEVSANEVFPIDEDAEQGVSDLSKLSNLHEAALLVNVEVRYHRKEIYTYVAQTLIVINPYQSIPQLLSQETINRYLNEDLENLDPHIFAISKQAYTQLWENKKNQAIVISGESGAGKTETTKHAMRFLTYLSGHSEYEGIEEKLIRCNPLLEAFGNAKTVRNDNSSRFGKYIRIFYNGKTKSISGASIANYLLEKSRVVMHSAGERNYHIFYLFCKHAPIEILRELGLTEGSSLNMDEYLYLRGDKDAETINDKDFYQDVMASFKITNFSEAEIHAIWTILAAILSIGNIEFDDTLHQEDDSEPCEISEDSGKYFENAARLLNISEDKFYKAITTYVRKIGGADIVSPLSKKDCSAYRESIAKALYDRLFNWIVFKLNKTLLPPSTSQAISIGLLDIFGFEVFPENGFEQFCINFTNEKLQQLYVSYIFKIEEQELRNEGLEEFITELNYVDNQPILDLLEKYPGGIFNLIDEACSVNSDDKRLLQQIIKTHKENQFFAIPKIESDVFTVFHTARDVDYTVNGFRVKNLDELRKELELCASESGDANVREIFTKGVGIEDQANKGKFLGAKFRRQMNAVMEELESCDCHFVRCIKPNEDKSPLKFLPRLVLLQIQYLGLLDSIAIRRQGYPIRYTYEQFFKRFEEIYPDNEKKNNQLMETTPDWQNLVEDVIDEYLPGIDEKYILFGKFKIFLKAEVNIYLEKAKLSFLKEKDIAASKIQGWLKARKEYQNFKNYLKIVARLQATYKAKKCRGEFLDIKEKTLKIQRWARDIQYNAKADLRVLGLEIFKKYLAVKMNSLYQLKYVNMAVTAQRLWRGYKGRQKAGVHKYIERLFNTRIFRPSWERIYFRMRLRAAVLIQKLFRGYRCRKNETYKVTELREKMKHRKLDKAATKVQAWAKGEIVRKKLNRMTKAARYIQGYFRAKWTYSLFKKISMEVRRIQRAVRSFIIRSKIIKERAGKYITQESALLNNLLLLEHSELFSTVPINTQNYQVQDAFKTLSTIAESTASLNKTNLLNTGSLALQSKQISPFHIEKMYFFTRVLDMELLTDMSIVYDPLWSQQLETLNRESISKEEQIMDIELGGCHSVAITNRGKLFVWGWNDKYQCAAEGLTSTNKPKLVEGLKEKRILQVSCGDDHTLALGSDGAVFAFGDNSKGQLGQGNYQEIRDVRGLNLPPCRQVYTAGSQSMAVTDNGDLYLWPFETIHGERRSYPMKVFNDVVVNEVSIGFNFAIILANSGLLYSLGSNNKEGQLGHGDTLPRSAPTLIASLKKQGEKIANVSCGFRHVIARSTLGKVYTWGWGSHGQLGHIIYSSEYLPKIVNIKGNRLKAIQISAGLKHSVILLENRKLYWAGTNGTISSQSTFQEVNLAAKIPEMFERANEFTVVRSKCSWSRGLGITLITIADIRRLQTPPSKLSTSLNLLASKWNNRYIEPPYIENVANFYPAIALRKGSPPKQPKAKRSDVSPFRRRDDKLDLESMKEKIKAILAKPEEKWTQEDKHLMDEIIKLKPQI